MATCRVCRTEVPSGVAQCPNCGYQLQTGASLAGGRKVEGMDIEDILEQAADQVEAGHAQVQVQGGGGDFDPAEVAQMLRNAAEAVPGSVTTTTSTDVQILTPGETRTVRIKPSWIIAFVVFDIVVAAVVFALLQQS